MCSLCGSFQTSEFALDEHRIYYRCGVCFLVFVPADFHLSRKEERNRYDLHENSIEDAGFTAFLGRLVKPLKSKYASGSVGLDFGSGPNPVLAQLLRKEGFRIEIFDSFYETNKGVFDNTFDFITLTEVIEHLAWPLAEMIRLETLLRSGGSIAVMTRLLDDSVDFSKWHYKNDRTHICFYSWETFVWLADYLKLTLVRYESDIVFFGKP